MKNIQYNAAVLYVEKNQYRIKQQNSIGLLAVLSFALFTVILYILRFIVAS
jgi:hypothetical protein